MFRFLFKTKLLLNLKRLRNTNLKERSGIEAIHPPNSSVNRDAQVINIDEIRATRKLFLELRSVKEASYRDELQKSLLDRYYINYITVTEQYLEDEKYR